MTDLSFAAQAVLNAFGTYPLRADHVSEDLIPALAAALRAAADQVAPEFWHEDNDIHGETMQDVRGQLLAIAAELEGNHTSEND